MDTDRRRSRLDAAPWLWLLQFGVAAAAFFLIFLSQLSVASCAGAPCDYALFSAMTSTFNVSALIFLVTAGLGIVVLSRFEKPCSWPPVVGMVLTIALLAATYTVGRAALDLPLFGGRLRPFMKRSHYGRSLIARMTLHVLDAGSRGEAERQSREDESALVRDSRSLMRDPEAVPDATKYTVAVTGSCPIAVDYARQ